jgi:tRNA threonylcarbamoyladenosine biosynthesis protein TsaE
MDSIELTSDSPGATERAAESVAPALRPGDVVLVSGDVGVGKTTFVRGACQALGVRERVTSPSFTIGRRYEGRLPVSHLDLFRLETLAGEDPGLLSDYLSPDAVAFVEWPQAAVPELEPSSVVLRVRLAHLGGDRRSVEASGTGPLVDLLRKALELDGRRSPR